MINALLQDEISFYGHPNIISSHPTTMEITKDTHLTRRGNCIVGVCASKACSHLRQNIRSNLCKDEGVVKIELIVEPYSFSIFGSSSSKLILSHHHDIVIRKSSYVDSRTLSIQCNMSSLDVPRSIIYLLQDSNTMGSMRITVE